MLVCWDCQQFQELGMFKKGEKDETVWKKATEFKVVKLPRRGPKEGQTAEEYCYGKTQGHNTAVAKYRKQQSMGGRG